MTQDSLVTGSGVSDYAPREQPGDYQAQGLTDAPFILQMIRVVPGDFAKVRAPHIEAKWVYERITALESALTRSHWQIARLQEDIDFLEGALRSGLAPSIDTAVWIRERPNRAPDLSKQWVEGRWIRRVHGT